MAATERRRCGSCGYHRCRAEENEKENVDEKASISSAPASLFSVLRSPLPAALLPPHAPYHAMYRLYHYAAQHAAHHACAALPACHTCRACPSCGSTTTALLLLPTHHRRATLPRHRSVYSRSLLWYSSHLWRRREEGKMSTWQKAAWLYINDSQAWRKIECIFSKKRGRKKAEEYNKWRQAAAANIAESSTATIIGEYLCSNGMAGAIT